MSRKCGETGDFVAKMGIKATQLDSSRERECWIESRKGLVSSSQLAEICSGRDPAPDLNMNALGLYSDRDQVLKYE